MTRIRRPLRAACTLAAAALAVAVAAPAQAAPTDAAPTAWPGARIERVSVGPGQAQATGESRSGGLSFDGRFAVFTSEAADLVPGDTTASPTPSSATCGPAAPNGSTPAPAESRPTVTPTRRASAATAAT
ncbi:hypothetical protein [Streptomyces sp. CBMA156]|uniref:hypothetical protein n=1 Tax=Streptomyces sp. CBMA156 TaxID=1930280 RepID=UPI001661FF49|nr:hypothetical protein [Streptomyces sp. CBMA156]